MVDWKTLGAYLLDDPDGSTSALIHDTYNGDVRKCRDALIKEYLKNGEVSWARVLTSLRNAHYKNLADKIEKIFLIQ